MDISNYNIEQCDAPSVLAAVLDAHDHPQKIDQIAAAISPIAAAAAAYSEGKPQLAQAITNKGVTTAADASLATMAQNVGKIVQSSIELQGDALYENQLFGAAMQDGEDPMVQPNSPYWNLYAVLVQLLSWNQNSFNGSTYSEQIGGNQYAGIILAEYYKGYATIGFSGNLMADAIITSDGGCYTSSATHTWNDATDGKGNRWVAFLFADTVPFTIDNADTCPRSIYIGGHVGTITSAVNGRISDIVVPDGNKLDDFRGNYTQNWGKRVVIRNIQDHTSGAPLIRSTTAESFYIQGTSFSRIFQNTSGAVSIVIKADTMTGEACYDSYGIKVLDVTVNTYSPSSQTFYDDGGGSAGCEQIILHTESFSKPSWVFCRSGGIKKLYIGYITNDRTKSINTGGVANTSAFTDLELQNGILKNINIAYSMTNVLSAETIALHILDKLGVNTGDTLTLKIGATALATIQNDATYSSYLTAAAAKGWSVIA